MSRAVIEQVIEGLQIQLQALYQLNGKDIPDKAIRSIAESFCQLTDDQQAKFFNEVALIMNSWGPCGMDNQAFYIGRHLKMCECSTDDARSFISNIHRAMDLSAEERAEVLKCQT